MKIEKTREKETDDVEETDNEKEKRETLRRDQMREEMRQKMRMRLAFDCRYVSLVRAAVYRVSPFLFNMFVTHHLDI